MAVDKRSLAIALAIAAVIVIGSQLNRPEPGGRDDGAPVALPDERGGVPATQDVRALTGKTSAEVAAVLGEPDSCERVDPSGAKGSLKCSYAGGRTEIVFINGQADWMTFYLPGVAFSPDVLTELGLPSRAPTHRNEHVIA